MKTLLLKLTSIIGALVLLLLPVSSLAASKAAPSPTPPMVEITRELVEPPAQIQQVLDIAYNEWETLAGKTLDKCNKYTKWRSPTASFGWCGGFVTWCMLEAGVDMAEIEDIPIEEKTGVYHVKEASVGKLARGYMKMNRTTAMPQKGFLLVYGNRKNGSETIHVGLVYDVEDLGEGKYRLTTIEGNMSNRVKMYVHDYDINAKQTKNLSAIPESDRTREENSYFNYKMQGEWFVARFLMPYVPGDETLEYNSTDEDFSPIESPMPEIPEKENNK